MISLKVSLQVLLLGNVVWVLDLPYLFRAQNLQVVNESLPIFLDTAVSKLSSKSPRSLHSMFPYRLAEVFQLSLYLLLLLVCDFTYIPLSLQLRTFIVIFGYGSSAISYTLSNFNLFPESE